jgi:hypothetical protein
MRTHQSALDNLEKMRLAARKHYFGTREIGGVSFVTASELVGRAPKRLQAAGQSPLAVAIRKQWPDAKPSYRALVERRWRELYEGLPLDDAILAVRANFSSPSAAMRAGVIKKRKYVGFKP